jgi:hypothetical protein
LAPAFTPPRNGQRLADLTALKAARRGELQHLPVEFGIDGLIGLNFLQNFDYEIRSLAGQICVRPAEADALPA